MHNKRKYIEKNKLYLDVVVRWQFEYSCIRTIDVLLLFNIETINCKFPIHICLPKVSDIFIPYSSLSHNIWYIAVRSWDSILFYVLIQVKTLINIPILQWSAVQLYKFFQRKNSHNRFFVIYFSPFYNCFLHSQSENQYPSGLQSLVEMSGMKQSFVKGYRQGTF